MLKGTTILVNSGFVKPVEWLLGQNQVFFLVFEAFKKLDIQKMSSSLWWVRLQFSKFNCLNLLTKKATTKLCVDFNVQKITSEERQVFLCLTRVHQFSSQNQSFRTFIIYTKCSDCIELYNKLDEIEFQFGFVWRQIRLTKCSCLIVFWVKG